MGLAVGVPIPTKEVFYGQNRNEWPRNHQVNYLKEFLPTLQEEFLEVRLWVSVPQVHPGDFGRLGSDQRSPNPRLFYLKKCLPIFEDNYLARFFLSSCFRAESLQTSKIKKRAKERIWPYWYWQNRHKLFWFLYGPSLLSGWEFLTHFRLQESRPPNILTWYCASHAQNVESGSFLSRSLIISSQLNWFIVKPRWSFTIVYESLVRANCLQLANWSFNVCKISQQSNCIKKCASLQFQSLRRPNISRLFKSITEL